MYSATEYYQYFYDLIEYVKNFAFDVWTYWDFPLAHWLYPLFLFVGAFFIVQFVVKVIDMIPVKAL